MCPSILQLTGPLADPGLAFVFPLRHCQSLPMDGKPLGAGAPRDSQLVLYDL